METYYGLKFNILPKEEIDRFTEYDRVVAQCHIANCGCIIVDDKYGEPSDPIKRLGLHAYRLTLTNPINKKAYDFKTEMPLEFKKMFFESRVAQKKADEEAKSAKRKVSRDTRSATKIKKGEQRRQKRRYGKA
jgi:hypothetical protein